ncbi:MAG: CHAT domain-containing protein [Actinomycetota bacterium]|nr:CHAT domain-containing protein [Actinomycetota bacterium]
MSEERGLRRWLRERKRAVERQKGKGTVQPSLVVGLGSVSEALWERNRYREALDTIDLALEAVRDVRDRTARLGISYTAWKSKAFIAGRLGLFRDSIEAYRRAIALGDRGAYESEHPQSSPGDTRELASVYFRIGDYARCLSLLEEAEERLRTYEPKMRETVRDDESARINAARSLAHLDLGEYDRAEACAANAVCLHEGLAGESSLGSRRLDRVLQTAIDYVHLGNARRERSRVTGSGFGGAHEAYAGSFRMLADGELRRLVGSDADRGLVEEAQDREADAHLERGRTYLLETEHEKAEEDLERALSLTSTSNLLAHAAAHHLYLGQARAKLGKEPEAERSLKEAVRVAEEHGTPETVWQALRDLAELLRADGRPHEATEALRRCVAAVEGLRQQNLPEMTKISMLALKEGAYEDLVLDLCGGPGGDRDESDGARAVREAFGYVGAAKSRVFAERLGRTDLPTAGVPPKLRRKEEELSRELRELQVGGREARVRDGDGGPYDPTRGISQTEERLRKLYARIAKSGARGEEYAAMRRGDPLNYGAVREILGATGVGKENGDVGGDPSRVVLVEYFATDKEVLAFVGRRDLEAPVLRRVPITRQALADWAFAVENTDAEDLGTWDLDRWQAELGPLVEPLEEWSEEDDLVWIVPHAELHLLPLHALKVAGRYLADRNPVIYSPSASVMRHCRAKGARGCGAALVLGDSLPPPDDLRDAREEAEAVAQLFGTEPFLGGRATKRALKDGLEALRGQLRALHLACHGRFDFREPLLSSIRLAPADGEECPEESADLSAEEVLGMEVDADLVALSACASGVSGRLPGDELLGLVRSFVYAGAPSLLVGLWYVADQSTRLLMERFYGALLDHGTCAAAVDKASALRLAQRHVMGIKGFEHPYFWSPFVLMGDWR